MRVYFQIFGWIAFPFVLIFIVVFGAVISLYETFILRGGFQEAWKMAREITDLRIPKQDGAA